MSQQITTVRGLSVPAVIGRRGGREPKYPFRTMAVGECIELFSAKELAAARNAAYREKQKNPGFNYGAVDYGEDADEWEHDHSGKRLRNGRRVYGRLWRMEPET